MQNDPNTMRKLTKRLDDEVAASKDLSELMKKKNEILEFEVNAHDKKIREMEKKTEANINKLNRSDLMEMRIRKIKEDEAAKGRWNSNYNSGKKKMYINPADPKRDGTRYKKLLDMKKQAEDQKEAEKQKLKNESVEEILQMDNKFDEKLKQIEEYFAEVIGRAKMEKKYGESGIALFNALIAKYRKDEEDEGITSNTTHLPVEVVEQIMNKIDGKLKRLPRPLVVHRENNNYSNNYSNNNSNKN